MHSTETGRCGNAGTPGGGWWHGREMVIWDVSKRSNFAQNCLELIDFENKPLAF